LYIYVYFVDSYQIYFADIKLALNYELFKLKRIHQYENKMVYSTRIHERGATQLYAKLDERHGRTYIVKQST